MSGISHSNPSQPDPALRTLILGLNKSAAESGVDIVLTVNGTLIAGELISNKKYLSLLKIDGTALEEALMQSWYQSLDDQSATYIHLNNVKFIQNDQLAANPGTLWRGRTESVDGFSFGKVS